MLVNNASDPLSALAAWNVAGRATDGSSVRPLRRRHRSRRRPCFAHVQSRWGRSIVEDTLPIVGDRVVARIELAACFRSPNPPKHWPEGSLLTNRTWPSPHSYTPCPELARGPPSTGLLRLEHHVAKVRGRSKKLKGVRTRLVGSTLVGS